MVCRADTCAWLMLRIPCCAPCFPVTDMEVFLVKEALDVYKSDSQAVRSEK